MSDLARHELEPVLRARRLGVDTFQQAVVYMRQDCHVCKSQGFAAQSQVEVHFRGRSLRATLNIVVTNLLLPGPLGSVSAKAGECSRAASG